MSFTEIGKYRDFIRYYLQKRAPKGRGEIARLANYIRVHPTFVSQVLGGSKEFNMEQGFLISQYLELSDFERKYFLLLIQKDKAGTKDLKDYYRNELTILRGSLLKVSNRLDQHRALSEEDQATFYSSWIYSAIRLFCSVKPGKTLEMICSHFDLSRKRAITILDFLSEKNLLVSTDDRFQIGSQHTHLPNDSTFIVRHHMNWRTKALQRHENIAEQELAFTAPMSISRKDFFLIRELILSCIKNSIEIAKDSEAEEVAFLAIDWLWIKPQL